MAADRDAARGHMQEYSGRAASLASEVVSLEQQLLDLKNVNLKLQRGMEEGGAHLGQVQKQLAAMQVSMAGCRQCR